MRNSSLLTIFKNGRKLSYERDAIIIRAEDTPSGVYYIVSGWVKVYTLNKDKEPSIIMTLFPGDVFPCAWALTGTMHQANFAALDNTELLRVSTARFKAAIKTQPTFSQDILQVFAHHFFRLTNEVNNLQYRSAREKVVLRLLSLAENFGRKENNKVVIRKHIPNEYIARSTNMTRETTSREMSRLTRKRLIRHTEEHIIIPDISELKRELEIADTARKPSRLKRTLAGASS